MRELLIAAPKKLSDEDVQKTWADYDGYVWRIDPNYEAEQYLHRYMLVAAGGTTRVLDLGSGPLTSLGQIGPGTPAGRAPHLRYHEPADRSCDD